MCPHSLLVLVRPHTLGPASPKSSSMAIGHRAAPRPAQSFSAAVRKAAGSRHLVHVSGSRHNLFAHAHSLRVCVVPHPLRASQELEERASARVRHRRPHHAALLVDLRRRSGRSRDPERRRAAPGRILRSGAARAANPRGAGPQGGAVRVVRVLLLPVLLSRHAAQLGPARLHPQQAKARWTEQNGDAEREGEEV